MMATHAFVPDTDNPESIRKFIKNVSKEIARLSVLVYKGCDKLEALEASNSEVHPQQMRCLWMMRHLIFLTLVIGLLLQIIIKV